jgi:parallel beta-helix repeat protein
MSISFVLFALFLVVSCNDETPFVSDISEPAAAPVVDGYAELEAGMQALEAELEGGLSALAKKGNVVEIPAGSNDALAGAIAQAGTGGTVLLHSGLHTESGTVEISQQVNIVGEAGAVLEVSTSIPADPVLEITDGGPALYVRNTSNVVIWGVDIRPPAGQVGGVAVLVENSPHTVIGETVSYGHVYGIFVQEGDHTRIWKNTVVTASPGPLLHPFTPIGIVNAVGGHVQIARNEVSNAVTGIFVSDEKGLLTKNESHGNVLGVVMCNFVPMPGPYNTTMGAEFSATQWTVTHNNAHDNFFVGYYVFDGANNNLLADNAASNNAAFDIILTAEEPRPGLPNAPATFDNHVVAGSYQGITIQDCGDNNNVDGGIRIPCQ